MDTNRFDRLTRNLGAGMSRRTLLRGALAGAAGAAGLSRLDAAASQEKVTICHWNEARGSYQQLTISAAGLNGHGKHANDILYPDFSSDQTCGDCNTTCGDGLTCGGDGTPGVCGNSIPEVCPLFTVRHTSGQCVSPCESVSCDASCPEGGNTCFANADGSAMCADFSVITFYAPQCTSDAVCQAREPERPYCVQYLDFSSGSYLTGCAALSAICPM
jgi:hypothetical protein